jgi:WD40 repeat protein
MGYDNIQIWDLCTRSCITTFKAHTAISEPKEGSEIAYNNTIQWTLDVRHLLLGGSHVDSIIWKWDSSTWQQVSDLWEGHDGACISDIAINNTSTLVASSSDDSCICLWELLERLTVAIFKHSNPVFCVMFSMDTKHILSGSVDKKIFESEWEVPQRYVLEDEWVSHQVSSCLLNHL